MSVLLIYKSNGLMQNQNAQHRKAKRGTYNRQILVLSYKTHRAGVLLRHKEYSVLEHSFPKISPKDAYVLQMIWHQS